MYIESKNILFAFIFFKESFKLLIFHFFFYFWEGNLTIFPNLVRLPCLNSLESVTFGAVVILLERHLELGGNEFQNQTKYLNKYKAER